MKKTLLTLSTLSILHAAPYIGVETGVILSKNIATIKGTDANNGRQVPFSIDEFYQTNSMLFGILGGYSFQKLSNFTPFIEADFRYSSQKKAKENLDFDLSPGQNQLEAEAISVKMGNSFGFMPGVDVAITEKLSALVGVRFSITQFEVRASHTSGNGLVRSDNNQKNKSYIFGVEPTVGAKYAFTKNISGRLTVGYNIGQRKKVISNYIGQQALANLGAKAGIHLRPRGVVVRAALIYTF